MGEISFNTDAMRTSADVSLEQAQDFINKFEQLKDALEHSTITGPVYDSAMTALQQKEQFVDEIRATLNQNADYSEERADAGDKLISDVSGGMR